MSRCTKVICLLIIYELAIESHLIVLCAAVELSRELPWRVFAEQTTFCPYSAQLIGARCTFVPVCFSSAFGVLQSFYNNPPFGLFHKN